MPGVDQGCPRVRPAPGWAIIRSVRTDRRRRSAADHLERLPRATRRRAERPRAARPVRDPGLPRPLRRAHPHTPLEQWDFAIVGEIDAPRRWTWEELRALPSEEVTVDIHCVTKWSKLGHVWQGVSRRHPARRSRDRGGVRRRVLRRRLHDQPAAGGPHRRQGLDRLRLRRRASRSRARRPGAAAGPPPLLLEERQVGARAAAADDDEPGFWEINGYHNYGDPWREQRYWGD